jgi:hypothetical protein
MELIDTAYKTKTSGGYEMTSKMKDYKYCNQLFDMALDKWGRDGAGQRAVYGQ